MTEKKDDLKEPEIAVSAVPINSNAQSTDGTPIPAGHSRFYCSKCHAVRKRMMHEFFVIIEVMMYIASLLTLFQSHSPTTCPIRRHHGDVPIVRHSTALLKESVSGVLYCKTECFGASKNSGGDIHVVDDES